MDTVAERGEARGRSEDHEPLRQVGQDLPLYRVLVTALTGRLHPSATPTAWQRGAEERRAGRSLERGENGSITGGRGTEPGNWAGRASRATSAGVRAPSRSCLPTARAPQPGQHRRRRPCGCSRPAPRAAERSCPGPCPSGMCPTIFPAAARSHFWRNLVSDSRGRGELRCFGNSYSGTISEL